MTMSHMCHHLKLLHFSGISSPSGKSLTAGLSKGTSKYPMFMQWLTIASVIFTSWVKMIDLIEKALSAENIGFVRIDGSKSNLQRKSSLQTFETDANCSVLLATISSAGVGYVSH